MARHNVAAWGLLVVGVFLLLLPVAVAVAAPSVLVNAQFFLRIIAATGGALIGGFIPGALQITLPGIKGAGALGVFALIYATNPPVIAALASNPLSPPTEIGSAAPSTSERINKWLFVTQDHGQPQIDQAHFDALQRWMMKSSDFKDLPVEILVSGGCSPTLEQGRQAAIRDLNIP